MSRQIRSKLKVLASAAIFVSAGLASSPSPASAANIIAVTSAGDSIDPNDGVISLREAFGLANSDGQDSIISLQPNTNYTLAACLNGAVAHTAANDLKIEGNGALIQQTCPDSRVITNTESASTLTLRNLSLTKDGYPSQAMIGAAISVDGPLRLLNVQIHDVHSGPANGNGDSIVFGGDLFNSGRPNVEVVGGSYTRNSGDVFRQSGGGLTVVGRARINGNEGFGIRLIDGSPVSITDSAVIGNSRGGVLTTGQGWTSLAITNSTIADNGGTGVTCSMCNDVRFDNVTVENNGTNHAIRGGGVSIVTNDHAPSRSFRFLNSRIEGNYSSRAGGGVRLTYEAANGLQIDTPLVVFDKTVIANNQTASDRAAKGAGIYAESISVEVVNGSSVRDNQAGRGKTTEPIDGGGIYLGLNAKRDFAPSLTVIDSEVIGNQATGNGGGIAVLSEGKVRIERSLIIGNVAARDGGGLRVAGGKGIKKVDVVVSESHIADNTARSGAGIAASTYSDFTTGRLTIDRSTLSGNTALSGSGGGLRVSIGIRGAGDFSATIKNSTITQNSAKRRGGGVSSVGTASIDLRFVTLTDNEAPTGANIYVGLEALMTQASVFASPIGGANCDLGQGARSRGDNFATDTSCDLSPTDALSLNLTPARQAELHEPLANNGGFAPTRMPIASTPFGGIIPASRCKGLIDQLGSSRPQGADCEPGAVEIKLHTCVRPQTFPYWFEPTKPPVDLPATFPKHPSFGSFGFDQKPFGYASPPSCAR